MEYIHVTVTSFPAKVARDMSFSFAKLFGGSAPSIAMVDAIAKVADGAAVLLDVRENKEVEAGGKASGAVHIPLLSLKTMADPRHPDKHADLNPDAPILIYCASGARAAMAVKTLAELGYSDVQNIGSIAQWKAAGGALEA